MRDGSLRWLQAAAHNHPEPMRRKQGRSTYYGLPKYSDLALLIFVSHRRAVFPRIAMHTPSMTCSIRRGFGESISHRRIGPKERWLIKSLNVKKKRKKGLGRMEFVSALHSFALAVRLAWIWHYLVSKIVAATQGSKRTPRSICYGGGCG